MESEYKLNSPFFYVNPKAYVFGKELLKFAKEADKISARYDIQIILSPQPTDIRLISNNTNHLLIFAQHIDPLNKGRGHGLILPEAVKEAGAQGVVLNHGEYQLKFSQISKAINIAKNLKLLTLVAGESLSELAALSRLAPDIILAEPSELIGTGKRSDENYIKKSIKIIKDIDLEIKVMHGAGISSGEDVKDIISLGSDGAGAASGIFESDNPIRVLEELIYAINKLV